MDQVLILWVLVRVKILFISSPGTDFIDVACPEFINGESGPCFYPFPVRIIFWSSSEIYPFWVPVLILSSKSGPGPDFIHFESGSGFYQAYSGQGQRPDFINAQYGLRCIIN